ncbi:hypothetical protein HPB52_019549 [Rhipicephalus sanguineus]|uniref:Peptidase M13 N-terminal domain-containing protein n=1 Tax=Rhipicephalus sanguineus TaxID=34632 RepID=A0A9D4PG95_RHISA|nr:hypothetical protein HPB52_019549 [Rhipicephalus sanguineus]
MHSGGTFSSRGAHRFASASDLDRACAVIDARRAGNTSTFLPICSLPSACKSDSSTSTKTWPGANVKTLRRVARDSPKYHRRPGSPTWAEMNKKYKERMEQDRSMRMNQETFGHVFSALLVLAFIVGVVALVLFLHLDVRPASIAESSRSRGALDDLRQLCTDLPTDHSCHAAVRELQEAVDLDADPCRDFHQYACGRSRPILGSGSSYISQVTMHFNSVVHDKLLNVSFDLQEGRPTSYSASILQMAQFHASCYWVFTGRNSGGNIKDVTETLGIDVAPWLAVHSAESLVELTVRTSLRTGMSAFLDVRLSEREVHLDVGSSIGMMFFNKSEVKQYVAESVLDLEVNISGPVEKIVDLDNKVDDLVMPSSEVMKFPYYYRHARYEEPFSGVEWCLLLTAWSFNNLFPAWLGASFLKTDATARFQKAFNEALTVVLRDNVVNFGVYLETTVLNRTWLSIFGEPGNLIRTAAEPYPLKMNDTFLPNLAAVIAAQVGTVDRNAVFDDSQGLVMGRLGYGRKPEGKFVIPPALVVTRGFLSLQLPEVNIGLFTLRYLILRAIYDRAAVYQKGAAPLSPRIAIKGPGMAAYVQSCFGQSLKKSLNKSLRDDAIKSLMGGRWAVAIALAMTDNDHVTSRRLDTRARRRLLLLALCASGCGDPGDADSCRDMSRITPEFITAYGCAEGGDYKCDCSAVNNCETHLPSVTDAGSD